MAKTKSSSASESSTDSIFKKLISTANKVVPNSTMTGSELDAEIRTWIDSGSFLLNMILSNKSDGGWPCGRVVQLFGPESIGKSTVAYKAIANAQAQGGICIYADIENAANKKFMQMLGVDLERLIWTNIPDVEDLFLAIEKMLVEIINDSSLKGKPVLVIIDSIAVLQTKGELESDYEANMNISLAKAKQLHKAFRKITYFLNKANACLFCIDQIKDNATGMGQSWALSGGKALPFFSSIRVYLKGKKKIIAKDPTLENEYQDALAAWKAAGGSKSNKEKPERIKAEEVTIGYEVTAYTFKNKTAPPDRTAHFRIIFSEGLDDAECYLDYLIKYGAVKQTTSWYEVVGELGTGMSKFQRNDWLEVLSDANFYLKVKEFLTDKLTIKSKSDGYLISTSDLDQDDKALLERISKEEEEGVEEIDSEND